MINTELKKYDGTYFCFECDKTFQKSRDVNKQNSVKCPTCKMANNTVKYSHPFVKIFKSQEVKKA